jgi:HD-GYP domain-containing protein (c-di-GMP phosphodiesterase class II)
MPESAALPRRVEWFIVSVFGLGAAAFTLAFFLGPIHDPLGLAVVVALTALCEILAVRLYFDGRVSVSFVGVAFAAMVFGAPGAVLVAGTSAITGGYLFAERSAPRLAFNFGQLSLSALAAWLVASFLATLPLHSFAVAQLIEGTVVSSVIFVVSIGAVTAVMSLSSGRNPLVTFRSNFAWLFPYYAALGLVAGCLAIAYEHLGISGSAALAVPVLLSRYSIKQVLDKTRDSVLQLERSNEQLQHAYIEIRDMSEELRDAYNGTLESLVAALDMRDQETRGHSTRVATHSLELAQMLGIKDQDELAMIYRGALMHDVGKIGVPDAILRKPSSLTEEEWVFMRKHSAMGYRILAQVPYLRPAARIVLAHHERWDGGGYPRGLKGEDIPLGARIFAISDTYDAIISDRPYRRGQSPEAALAEILRCAGSQFDPQTVEAFEGLFPRWNEGTEQTSPKLLYLPKWDSQDEKQRGDRAAS